jgi:hypothetical protein
MQSTTNSLSENCKNPRIYGLLCLSRQKLASPCRSDDIFEYGEYGDIEYGDEYG